MPYSFLNIIGANQLGGETTRGETTSGGETTRGKDQGGNVLGAKRLVGEMVWERIRFAPIPIPDHFNVVSLQKY